MSVDTKKDEQLSKEQGLTCPPQDVQSRGLGEGCSLSESRRLLEVMAHKMALLLVQSGMSQLESCKIKVPLVPCDEREFSEFKQALVKELLDNYVLDPTDSSEGVDNVSKNTELPLVKAVHSCSVLDPTDSSEGVNKQTSENLVLDPTDSSEGVDKNLLSESLLVKAVDNISTLDPEDSSEGVSQSLIGKNPTPSSNELPKGKRRKLPKQSMPLVRAVEIALVLTSKDSSNDEGICKLIENQTPRPTDSVEGRRDDILDAKSPLVKVVRLLLSRGFRDPYDESSNPHLSKNLTLRPTDSVEGKSKSSLTCDSPLVKAVEAILAQEPEDLSDGESSSDSSESSTLRPTDSIEGRSKKLLKRHLPVVKSVNDQNTLNFEELSDSSSCSYTSNASTLSPTEFLEGRRRSVRRELSPFVKMVMDSPALEPADLSKGVSTSPTMREKAASLIESFEERCKRITSKNPLLVKVLDSDSILDPAELSTGEEKPKRAKISLVKAKTLASSTCTPDWPGKPIAKSLHNMKCSEVKSIPSSRPIYDSCQDELCTKTEVLIERIMHRLAPLYVKVYQREYEPHFAKSMLIDLTETRFDELRRTCYGSWTLIHAYLPAAFFTPKTKLAVMEEQGLAEHNRNIFCALEPVFPCEPGENRSRALCLMEVMLHHLAQVITESHECMAEFCGVELPEFPLDRAKFSDFKRALIKSFVMTRASYYIQSNFTFSQLEGIKKKPSTELGFNYPYKQIYALKLPDGLYIRPRIKCKVPDEVIHETAWFLMQSDTDLNRLPVSIERPPVPCSAKDFKEFKTALVKKLGWNLIVFIYNLLK